MTAQCLAVDATIDSPFCAQHTDRQTKHDDTTQHNREGFSCHCALDCRQICTGLLLIRKTGVEAMRLCVQPYGCHRPGSRRAGSRTDGL
jgi:hypothetical protein